MGNPPRSCFPGRSVAAWLIGGPSVASMGIPPITRHSWASPPPLSHQYTPGRMIGHGNPFPRHPPFLDIHLGAPLPIFGHIILDSLHNHIFLSLPEFATTIKAQQKNRKKTLTFVQHQVHEIPLKTVPNA